MNKENITSKQIANSYDAQSQDYAQFAEQRFAWKFIEAPAYDRYISDLYSSTTRVLEIGCGTATVGRHLISKGILPENYLGIDISTNQLTSAHQLTPGSDFVQASATSLPLSKNTFDLVITNTVLHHLDNEACESMLDNIRKVLVTGGSYFFVEVDPDHTKQARELKNLNIWQPVDTPWGTQVPFYNRDPRYFLTTQLDKAGFDYVSGWTLKVEALGEETDPKEFERYSNRPSRMAGRYVKRPDYVKILRSQDIKPRSLIRSPKELAQESLVERYFEAWNTQSVSLINQIFSSEAIYDEKPGKQAPIQGIDRVLKYWHDNPLQQRNISTKHRILGNTNDSSIWVEFQATFSVRGENVELEGVICFTTDHETNKIIKLQEYFHTTKQPAY